MAILPAVPAFSTTIVVNGEPADEYQPPHIPIPDWSELLDTILSPYFSFGDNTDTLLVSTYIDGNLIEESLVFKHLVREQDFIEYISHRHRDYADGNRVTETFYFQDLAPTECTTAATLQADMQLVKTLGTIRVVLTSAKTLDYDPKHGPLHNASGEAESINSLQLSTKALILNGNGQTHGTGFQQVDVPVHFGHVTYIDEMNPADDLDTLAAQKILDPANINQAAQGMPQTLESAPEPPRYAVRTMSNGCLEIDLTGDDE
ncbi:uncharacterized protein FTJAE_5239 [Fusarium tjaetaba]|uniref:DUF7918 domain-containing protein n=1 Tax=Fusarium tjaetaba TaxID=1567544 RepID=A0A8H5RPH6_9HYPO|nr:uncharacterized protein FTJAE_5239 [Fusarium tjaetaba]KAF5638576.1 hypothetical protein FTJAE_5239 [Fusarium tjaetaba]